MTDLPDHDPDPGDHDRPIFVITMDRSWRSRWAETRTFVSCGTAYGEFEAVHYLNGCAGRLALHDAEPNTA